MKYASTAKHADLLVAGPRQEISPPVLGATYSFLTPNQDNELCGNPQGRGAQPVMVCLIQSCLA